MSEIGNHEIPPSRVEARNHGDLKKRLEATGDKAEARFVTDNPGVKVPDGFDVIVKMSDDFRVKFRWMPISERQVPEEPPVGKDEFRLSGALFIKYPPGTFTLVDKYPIGLWRTLDFEQPRVDFHEYEDDKCMLRVKLETHPSKLDMLHNALIKVEEALDDPHQPIEWHAIGDDYEW
jgi:hypothetical protein